MDAVVVRRVFKYNLYSEFKIIRANLPKFSFIAIDTEFPGVVFHSKKSYYDLTVQENYEVMKENVNSLKLIQLGLTMCDAEGNLPRCISIDEDGESYSECGCVWEFNFEEFDADNDLQNPDSIRLLKNHGIDFRANRLEGIRAEDFAKLFLSSGLGFSLRAALGRQSYNDVDPDLTWVFFHSTYDVGYLIKLVTHKELPANLADFMKLVQICLGRSVFDLKEIVKEEPFGWAACGLKKVAENLTVKRLAGESHQAGSDSLLTMQCFFRVQALISAHFGEKKAALMLLMLNYKLHGFGFDGSKAQRQGPMTAKRNYQYPSWTFNPSGEMPHVRILIPVPAQFHPMKNCSNVVSPYSPSWGCNNIEHFEWIEVD